MFFKYFTNKKIWQIFFFFWQHLVQPIHHRNSARSYYLVPLFKPSINTGAPQITLQ